MASQPAAAQDLRTRLQAASAGTGEGLRRGLWLSFLDPYGLEVATGCGPDWVGVDLQHGNIETHHLPGLLRVAEAAGLPLLARTASHDPAALGRVLDTGVSGVIIPMVESAAQAQDLVSACRTPPVGNRSTGGCRATLGVTQQPEPQLVLPMVETVAGLHNAADILAVPGIDGVFFGPYDLSISAGHSGPDSTQTIQALRHTISLARTAGKVVGFMAGGPELIQVAPEADLIAVDTDTSALRHGLAQLFT
ncbi:HpcH/HpaI aldolase family protein [Ornithinimicrobium sp. W1665]|uniref:HpcH/HpaI aldolase family protein n=1 Tax=Ornithinimicrobium sp. W1665 TaxID=3416666 RepID=UPI003CE938A8